MKDERSSKKDAKDYIEVKFPQFRAKKPSLNAFLVLVLIIFAFFLGMLTNKVIYLEKVAKEAAAPAPSGNALGAAVSQAPLPPAVVDVDPGSLPFLGDSKAKVTIVEFSDFQCPYCEKFYNGALKEIFERYIKTGKVRFAYRHYPLSFHTNAQKASEASECANDQNRFWDFHNKLFEIQTTWSPQTPEEAENTFVDMATTLGMNSDQFRSCLDTDKYQQKVKSDMAAGEKVQVDGTPAFFINGNRLTGALPFASFEELIEKELKK